MALQGQSRESREGGDAAPQHGMQNSQQKDQALRPHERPVGLAQRQGSLMPGSRGSCFQDHGRHAGINLMRNIHQRWETREIP